MVSYQLKVFSALVDTAYNISSLFRIGLTRAKNQKIAIMLAIDKNMIRINYTVICIYDTRSNLM